MRKLKRKFIITFKLTGSSVRRDCQGLYRSILDIYKNPPIPKAFRGKNYIIEDIKTEEEFIDEIFRECDNSELLN